MSELADYEDDHIRAISASGQRAKPSGMIAVKGQLNLALTTAIEEARALANYYDNVAKQLTLLASQVEDTK